MRVECISDMVSLAGVLEECFIVVVSTQLNGVHRIRQSCLQREEKRFKREEVLKVERL